MKKTVFLILILAPAVFSCKETPTGSQTGLLQTGADTLCSTITYDVVVKNPDSTDVWMNECLKDMKREELIDLLFEGIYNGRITAYDIFENKRISPGKLKRMEDEDELIRDKIGKFQFVEVWYLDKTNMTMTKRVKEIRLGTEAFSSDEFLVGYEPLFKVVLN